MFTALYSDLVNNQTFQDIKNPYGSGMSHRVFVPAAGKIRPGCVIHSEITACSIYGYKNIELSGVVQMKYRTRLIFFSEALAV